MKGTKDYHPKQTKFSEKFIMSKNDSQVRTSIDSYKD